RAARSDRCELLLRRALRDPPGDVRSIPAHPAHLGGGEGVLERQAAEEEPWYAVDDAPVLDRPTVANRQRYVDPVVDLPEAGRPDHGPDVEGASVSELRQPV